jgi:hypothetical protein
LLFLYFFLTIAIYQLKVTSKSFHSEDTYWGRITHP